jgi:hypothetical protein
MRSLVLALLSVSLLSARSLAGEEPSATIVDHGDLFKAGARDEAEEVLRDVRRRHDILVLIETFTAVPKEDQARLHHHLFNQSRYYREWAQLRARDAKFEGLYVLIYHDPNRRVGSVNVLWRPESHDAPVSAAECERLRRTFIDTQRQTRDNNRGLLALVGQVREHLDRPAEVPPESKAGVPWTTILTLVAAGLLLWLLLALIRMRLNARSGEDGDGRHRGFMPGLFGGLFGTAAGLWIYDTMFHHSDKPADALPTAEVPPPAPLEEAEKGHEPAPDESPAGSPEH